MRRKKNWQDFMGDLRERSEIPWQEIRDAEAGPTSGAGHKKPGKRISAKTPNQQVYLNSMSDHTVTLCTGPAGCGKTYMACGLAANWLYDDRIKKIILTRPIVECGQRLGALPGTLGEKTDPYMAPMFDAFGDFLDPKFIKTCRQNQTIEVVPLETMRGRTFHDAVIILDEAQNVTRRQMKMFMTRFGQNSKVIVCGDVTQTDLPHSEGNPLMWVCERLGHPDIAKVVLGPEDVQRHGLIRHILERLGE
jgi:phosphate starvation-inducible PhoH-like protein